MLNRIVPALCLALLVASIASAANGQVKLPRTAPATSSAKAPEVPADLSPEMVDALLARLTDSEIRALLHDELKRRADEHAAAEAATDEALVGIEMRLSEMATNIKARVGTWADALTNIGDRREMIGQRLGRAENGIIGMIAATLAVAVAGIGAALAVGWLTGAWRRWLAVPQPGGYRGVNYWDRVVRTIALGVLELAPVIAFVFATVSVAPAFAGALGPMIDYVWIYQVGVSYSWGFIIIAHRAFATDASAIRIAHLTDSAATKIHSVVRRAVQIGAAGWLIAGLSPTLGFGYPPGLITVSLAGTAVTAYLLTAAARNYTQIRAAVSALLHSTDGQPGTLARIAVAAAPVALIVYLLVAWLYWFAHWLESGQQWLYGPAGTLIYLLLIPIIDRLGFELVRSVTNGGSQTAERYRAVFHGAWRMLLGIASVFVIAELWGLDLYALAKGDAASRWVDTAFDIAVTLLLARFVWQLILAALYRERAVPTEGAEEGGEIPAASRLDTLLPLLRNVLLSILAVVVVMIVLASGGVNIGPLLASAGIVGIAVGFGAQTLVRDIFSGAFFLFDDAFRVGEYIELDKDLRGEVESISVRSLQLRHHRGPIVTIPFGELKSVTNHNRDWVIFKMNFRLEPETDPDQVKRLVKEVGKELLADVEHGPKFLEPLKSQGVYMIDDDSAVVIRVKFKCKPRAQFVLRREVYHRLRKVFAENGLYFARRKVEVVSSGADGAAASGAAAQQGDIRTSDPEA